VRKKGAGAKVVHPSAPETVAIATLQMAHPFGAEESIKSLLDIPPATLPLLNPSTAGNDTAATESSRVKGDVELQSRSAVWDESPMPLASPPKWRTLAVGAITGAVGMATGGIDPDDVDGPRKRTR
jgi:hypothetical protein